MKTKLKIVNHLQENKMTYTEHLFFALFCSLQCLVSTWYLAIHAFVPCIFKKSGSSIILKLAKNFKKRG